MAVLNVGGVANVTFVDGGDPVACDTGPGNALIDDFMRARTGAPYDNHGDAAADGKADQAFIDRVLADRFLLKPPKSLDRNAFAFANIGLPDYSVADGAATLRRLRCRRSAALSPHLPGGAEGLDRCRRRRAQSDIDEDAQERLAPATVETADEAGWSADALEAQAFAYLAVRTLNGLPITFPPRPASQRQCRAGWLRGPSARLSGRVVLGNRRFGFKNAAQNAASNRR